MSKTGTVHVKVAAQEWGNEFRPTVKQVLEALKLLVPGDHLEIDWIPYPMGPTPQNARILNELREVVRK